MSLELEENVPTTEEEDEGEEDEGEEDEEEEEEEEDDAPSDKRTSSRRNKGAVPTPGPKKKGKKKNQPGKYSQLVVDTIRKLGERNGSSLAKIYSEAKKVSWFDQQNGRTYLKYSVKALVQNDTLLQVKGVGANGSFRLNKKKLEGGVPEKKAAPAPKPTTKRVASASSTPKKSHKKAKPKAKKEKPKKSSPKPAAKSPKKKPASGGSKKVKKTSKPSVPKVPKSKKA